MFFAALFLWLLMNKKHTMQQCMCMLMIMVATFILGLSSEEDAIAIEEEQLLKAANGKKARPVASFG